MTRFLCPCCNKITEAIGHAGGHNCPARGGKFRHFKVEATPKVASESLVSGSLKRNLIDACDTAAYNYQPID